MNFKMNKKLDALLDTLENIKTPKETVSVIHTAYEDKPRIVAFVEVDKSLSIKEKLELAFVKTNSITEAWWDNEDVNAMFPGSYCRSTSVGDMVLIDKMKYVCESDGWRALDLTWDTEVNV